MTTIIECRPPVAEKSAEGHQEQAKTRMFMTPSPVAQTNAMILRLRRQRSPASME
jgi:hypothetical protein